MDLLANDLSVHEQFHDLDEFRDALSRLMALRGTARLFGREVHCHRTFFNTAPMPGMSLQKAIGNLGIKSQRQAVMSWLNRSGPFWDDARRHIGDDYLECGDDVVTDTAVGEAAFRNLHGMDCGLVSLTPSQWCCSPVKVTWVREDEGADNRVTEVGNWWCTEALEAVLQDQAPPIGSWSDLREASRKRFTSLTITEDCFAPLAGVPFAKSAADSFLVLLGVLDRLALAFDDKGIRSAEGHRIYADHFTGDRALFSDSSDTEKHEFSSKLTFPHPEDPTTPLFCPRHGKISRMTLRLHFSWPVVAGKPVYVVYAGPKITKR